MFMESAALASDDRARCIAQLKSLLERDPDVEVRAAAAVGLADAGATDVVPALVAAAQAQAS